MKEQFLDIQGLELTIKELKKQINGVVVSCDTIFNFPTVGNENSIYIDRSSDTSYRWDEENLKYYKVGFSPDKIESIIGGNAQS